MSERPVFRHPALELLTMPRWDAALGWLHGASTDRAPRWRLDDIMSSDGDRASVQNVICDLVDALFAVGSVDAGRLATAWQMLTVDPTKPESFVSVMPQLQHALDNADLVEHVDEPLCDRIRIWWRGAEGEWADSDVSIFRIAAIETSGVTYGGDPDTDPKQPAYPNPMKQVDVAWKPVEPTEPSLVVMPKARASKLNNFHAAYKEIVDTALPLVVVLDVTGMRVALHAEFPHATVAVDLVLRDLREGKPFFVKPICLVGSPGAGKSRLVRRVVDLVRGLHVQRFDAASSSDSVGFAGSAKSWSNTEPSVPFRAVAQSRTANPVVLLDELDKAAGHRSGGNGRITDSLLAYLDRETSSRQRDQSLDAELDLSMVSYVATANDVTGLPSPLRDRFRIIKVPTPSLQHLPPLAAQIMRDLAIDDDARSGDAPLAGDELDVCGKAWSKAGFSMRKLQAIVRATLEARDQCAMRH